MGRLLRNKRRYGDAYKRGTFAFAAWIREAFARTCRTTSSSRRSSRRRAT